ncbi:MAG: hypothetical protein ACRERE_40460 [Candidatus Entotheonellia bacterium]
MTHLRRGLAAVRAPGVERAQPSSLARPGEAYGALGHAGEGRPVVAKALATIYNTGTPCCAAALLRITETLLVAGAAAQQAAACVQRALDVARRRTRHRGTYRPL